MNYSTGADIPRDHDGGHFTPVLLALFATWHAAGIMACEWGFGLSRSMGAPEAVMDHLFIIPAADWQRAGDVAESSGLSARPADSRPYKKLGDMARWFEVPDQGGTTFAGYRWASLLLFSTADIPLSVERTTFFPAHSVWRPTPIEAVRLNVQVACALHEPTRYTANSKPLIWVGDFVCYSLMGMKRIPKTFIGELTYPGLWEQTARARLDGLPWSDDLLWLKQLLACRVNPGMDDRLLTQDWWEHKEERAAALSSGLWHTMGDTSIDGEPA